MRKGKENLPLVYSCSGCSNSAQMANYVALELDKRGAAEMSGSAGVAAGIPSLLKLARSGRPVIVLDGCPVACAKKSLAQHAITPDDYIQLGSYGVKKSYHMDFDMDKAEMIIARVIDEITYQQSLKSAAPHGRSSRQRKKDSAAGNEQTTDHAVSPRY